MRRLNDERGAIAVTVALLAVVLFGVGAIVIDTGSLYQERRELQNGADAAALAIAQSCAHGDCGSVDDTAAQYADDNALDGTSNVDSTDVDEAAQTVTVSTSTETSGGLNQITYKLAGFLSDANDGKTVTAKATAKWGAPSSIDALPLTVAECELDSAIDLHGYVDLDAVDSATPTVLMFHDGNPIATGGDCGPAASANQDDPGGFGWLDVSGVDDCKPTITADETIDGDNGSGPPPSKSGCDDVLPDLVDTVVYVPIYDWVAGQKADGSPCANGGNKSIDDTDKAKGGNGGNNTTTTTSSTTTTTAPTTTTTVKDNGNGGGCTRTYSIIGFGAFYLTGYHLSGSGWDAPSKAAAPCSGDERCIAGHFVQFVTSDALVGDGTTDFGLTAINLID